MQRGVEQYLSLLEGAVEADDAVSGREKAISTLATLVGALVLARAVEDHGLSDEILQAATQDVLSRAKREEVKREALQ